MTFKLLLMATLLATLLGGCVTTTGSDELQRMQRNQDAAREMAA